MQVHLTLTFGAPVRDVFAAVGLWRGGKRIGFEGSYGFGDPYVPHGMLQVKHSGQVTIPLLASSTTTLPASSTTFCSGDAPDRRHRTLSTHR